MLLVAEDSGLIVQHKAVTNVTIFVEDENDNKPEFAESSYNVYTPDNAVGGKCYLLHLTLYVTNYKLRKILPSKIFF